MNPSKKCPIELQLNRTVSIIKSTNTIIPTLFLYIIGRKFSTSQSECGGLKGAKNEIN